MLMMIVVCGDDTQALRDTISSLCSLNKVGKFASCCGSYDNGASITLASSPAEFYKGVCDGGVRPSLKSDCPQPYIQLVQMCLQSDPHSRPSFEQIASTVFGVN